MDKVPMTTQGFARLDAELKHRKGVERPRIIAAIQEARAHGDLSENAEYHAAREQQSFNEGRINELEDKLSRADVIDITKMQGDTVKFGATVTLEDDDSGDQVRFTIVGPDESNIEAKQISMTAPMARASIGKKVGDGVEVNTPGGQKSFTIIDLKFVVG